MGKKTKKHEQDCLSKNQSFKKQFKKIKKDLTKKEKAALQEAAMVLWLSDSSDYINGLWDVIRVIVGDILQHKDFDLDKILVRESDN